MRRLHSKKPTVYNLLSFLFSQMMVILSIRDRCVKVTITIIITQQHEMKINCKGTVISTPIKTIHVLPTCFFCLILYSIGLNWMNIAGGGKFSTVFLTNAHAKVDSYNEKKLCKEHWSLFLLA